MNRELIAALEELRYIAEIEGEVYREKAYRKAIASIRKLGQQITKNNLPDPKTHKVAGIGTGIAAKIAEFVRTGRIAELDKLRKSPRVRAYRILSGILGVGPSTIDAWIGMRIRDLPALRRAVSSGRVELTNAQKLGLKYYADLNERIPRNEVTEIGQRVRALLEHLQPGIQFEISGSYRRGAATCGDIDIITTHAQWQPELLSWVKTRLGEFDDCVGIVGAGAQRLTFLYHSPTSGKVRQVDILYIPPEQFAPAVLYFTGSSGFNEYMRGIAKRKGYRLNQMGLYRVKKDGDLEPVTARSEREIFDILGIEFRPPEERN